jgi:hypothetical protein
MGEYGDHEIEARQEADDDLMYAEWLQTPEGREAEMWATCPNNPAIAEAA